MKIVQPIRDKTKIDEMKSVLLQRSFRDWFLFVLGINVGLRVGDLIKLKIRDVRNKDHIIIVEEKTGKEKRFKINGSLKEQVQKYTNGLDENGYLFPSIRGTHIGRVQAYRILNEAASQVGLCEIGTHTLRKTFGYWHYQQFQDVAMLQKIFQHSSPAITLRYIGIDQDLIDASIDKFVL